MGDGIRVGWRRAGVVALTLVASLAAADLVRAHWADSESVSHQRVTTGRLGLSANGSVAAVIGPLTITPSFAAPVTQHVPLTIANTGNVELAYKLDSVTADVASNPLFTTGLTMRIAVVATTTACTGTNPGTTIIAAGTSPVTATFATRRTLQPTGVAGDREVLCVSLTIPLPTNASFRAGTVALTLNLHGQST